MRNTKMWINKLKKAENMRQFEVKLRGKNEQVKCKNWEIGMDYLE